MVETDWPLGAFSTSKAPACDSTRAGCLDGWTTNMANESSGQESTDAEPTAGRNAAAVAKRVHRALDSFFHVKVSDAGKHRVHSGSGSTYTVTLPDGACTCPDGQRGAWCKHAFRALFQTGDVPDVEGVPEREPGDTETGREESETNEDRAETLDARVERFAESHPDASAIEVISQLGIDPAERERVEEVLA